jgi:CubicO group peptidase (beta-lactamase class C family)
MMSSGYLWNDTFERLAARPHDRAGNPLNNRKRTAADAARYAAAGDLYTTATDYAKFLIEIIAPKKSDAFRLGTASLEEMRRPHVKVAETADYSSFRGLGWQIGKSKDGEVINHGGHNEGFNSFVEASVKRRSGYVILTNGETGVELLKKLVPTLSRQLHVAVAR